MQALIRTPLIDTHRHIPGRANARSKRSQTHFERIPNG